jgi:5'-methylthioadenosine phosphorylase
MSSSSSPVIGILGGSGLYQIDGLADVEWRRVESPFGAPSDELCFGRLGKQRVVFLPRHGRGHKLSPSEINFRANIDALKRVGVTEILSLSAVGSLRDGLVPGDFVLVDQFIDRTFAREKSFFGTGCVAHVSMAQPICARLGDALAAAAGDAGIKVARGGTYMVMEGPQFSTLAESRLYRSWGCDVIGMTNMPEAKLAREAELCYATVAMVTDYDCWHPGHDAVTVEMVVRILLANADKARALVKAVVPRLAGHAGPCRHGCQTALDHALITAPEARDPAVLARLDAVAGRVLRG